MNLEKAASTIVTVKLFTLWVPNAHSISSSQIPMKKIVSCFVLIAGITAAVAAAPAAQAYTLNSNLSCTKGTVTGASQCAGSYTLGAGENDVTNGAASNIATKLLNENGGVFGGTSNWTFGNKYDGSFANNSNTQSGFNVTGLNTTAGSFGLGNINLATTDLAVSLKSAKGFSLYYIKAGTITNPNQIAWNTFGTSVNGKGAGQALSHISYFTRMVPTPPVRVRRVPEPAALSALLAVGAAAIVRRKQRQAK
jgi:hypothetical protein